MIYTKLWSLFLLINLARSVLSTESKDLCSYYLDSPVTNDLVKYNCTVQMCCYDTPVAPACKNACKPIKNPQPETTTTPYETKSQEVGSTTSLIILSSLFSVGFVLVFISICIPWCVFVLLKQKNQRCSKCKLCFRIRRFRRNERNANRRRNTTSHTDQNFELDAAQPSEINVNDLPKYEEIMRPGRLGDNGTSLNAQTSYRTCADDETAVYIYINDLNLNDVQLPKYSDLNLAEKK